MRKNRTPSHSINDRLETIQQIGADLVSRRIYLCGEISEGSTRKFLINFDQLEQASDKEVTVILNSMGGSSYDGMAIYDAIKNARSPVTIIGTGHVMSAAAIIIQAGTRRVLTPETRFMLHNGHWELDGPHSHASVIVSCGEEMRRVGYRMHQIIADRSGQPLQSVEAWFDKETFFSARDAVHWGLADEIQERSRK